MHANDKKTKCAQYYHRCLSHLGRRANTSMISFLFSSCRIQQLPREMCFQKWPVFFSSRDWTSGSETGPAFPIKRSIGAPNPMSTPSLFCFRSFFLSVLVSCAPMTVIQRFFFLFCFLSFIHISLLFFYRLQTHVGLFFTIQQHTDSLSD